MQSDFPIDEERLHQPGMTIAPEPGDVLFGNRPCSVQTIMTIAGEQWTHVAVVIGGDDGPRTVELGPKGMLSRPVDEFIDRYRQVGLARPRGSDHCRQAMNTAALLHLQLDLLAYSWERVAIIGSTAIAQRLAPDASRRRIAHTGLRAADRFRRASSSSPTAGAKRPATCSSLIVDLFEARCTLCRPRVEWPARSAVRLWDSRPSPADVVGLDGPPPLAATRSARPNKMATPADIWVAEGFAFRAVTDHNRTTIVRRSSGSEAAPSGSTCLATVEPDEHDDRQSRAGKEVTS